MRTLYTFVIAGVMIVGFAGIGLGQVHAQAIDGDKGKEFFWPAKQWSVNSDGVLVMPGDRVLPENAPSSFLKAKKAFGCNPSEFLKAKKAFNCDGFEFVMPGDRVIENPGTPNNGDGFEEDDPSLDPSL